MGSTKKRLALIGLTAVLQESSANVCAPLTSDAEKFIKAYSVNARSVEDCNARMVARGDVTADGVEDLIVIFTIEGACGNLKSATPGSCGNHHETHLKTFPGKTSPVIPVREVGSRGERQMMQIKVVDGTIQTETLKYGKDDAMCCPSVKGKTRFVVNKGTIVVPRP
ncbi:MAG: hypothetical protein LH481_13320 [Burkholderiales bacterium]|nr:hypothetical protein [Burkholderiales bacterium]